MESFSLKFLFWKIILLASLLIITACGGNSGNDISSIGPEFSTPPELDIGFYDTSIEGALRIGGDGNKYVRWDNYSTGENGTAQVTEDYDCFTFFIVRTCGNEYDWEVLVPLTDGANDIELTHGSESYSKLVYYTDIGTPEVDYHSGTISLGMPQWPTEVEVSFNKLMDEESINSETFYVLNPDGHRVSGTPVVNSTYGDRAIIEMSGSLDTVYTAIVTTGVTDYWGSPLSSEYSWDFKFGCGWATYVGNPCP